MAMNTTRMNQFFTNLLLIQHLPKIAGIEPALDLIKQFAYRGEIHYFDMAQAQLFYRLYYPIIHTIHTRQYSYKYIWVKNDEDDLIDLEEEDELDNQDVFDIFDIEYEDDVDFDNVILDESEYSDYAFYCNAGHWNYTFHSKKEKKIQLQAVNCVSCSNYIITNTPTQNYSHFPFCRCRQYDINEYVEGDGLDLFDHI